MRPRHRGRRRSRRRRKQRRSRRRRKRRRRRNRRRRRRRRRRRKRRRQRRSRRRRRKRRRRHDDEFEAQDDDDDEPTGKHLSPRVTFCQPTEHIVSKHRDDDHRFRLQVRHVPTDHRQCSLLHLMGVAWALPVEQWQVEQRQTSQCRVLQINVIPDIFWRSHCRREDKSWKAMKTFAGT
jgi:hypothetical protein